MFANRLVRRSLVLTGALAVLAPLAIHGPSVAQSAPEVSPGPHGAARIYLWGVAHWKDEFLVKLDRQWETNHPKSVETRFGMLTLKGRRDGRPTGVTLRGEPHRYGRWESRVRIRNWNDGPVPYHLWVELVPAGKQAKHCGARTITLANYAKGDSRARMSIRRLPKHQFTYSKRQTHAKQVWNTYAVEITKKHIAWFVDDHVVMRERRPAALSGINYTVRYRFDTPKQMKRDPSWMQMDWSRYFTLKRPNAKSIKAPRANKGTYHNAC